MKRNLKIFLILIVIAILFIICSVLINQSLNSLNNQNEIHDLELKIENLNKLKTTENESVINAQISDYEQQIENLK